MNRPNQAIVLDALGNSTRRDVLMRLAVRPCSVQELSSHYSISRPAISKHLKILGNANLVEAKQRGSRNEYSLKKQGFDEAGAWLHDFWDVALARLAIVAENSES